MEFDVSSQYNNIPQLLSYYPKYSYMDNLLSCNSKKNINVYVDVKGCCTGIYQEWCIKHIIETSSNQRHLNLDLFSSILSFISFHKLYAAKRGLNVNLYFFMEQGKSKYHTNIYNKYKENRKNSDFFGLDTASREKFFNVLDKNYSLCEYVINRIPKCKFFILKYCEADFIPYYLMKNKISQEELEDSLNIIYSRDKDMLQCLEFPNTYQFYKAAKSDKTSYIKESGIMSHFVKEECKPVTNCSKWFPLILSLCGDTADGVPGIKGIGPKVINKHIDTILKAYNYDPENMYKRVMNGDNLLTESWEHSCNATISKIFSNPENVKRNMKLISYRALTEYVDSGFPLETIEIKKYIDKIWNNEIKLSSYSVLWENLVAKKLDDIIDIRTIESCFL